MNKIIQRDLLAVLNSMLTILDKNSYELAKEVGNLSDRTIHNASIFQDEDSTSLAVMVYAISKILGRGKKIDKSLLKSIQSA